MSEDLKARADARLDAALADADIQDPRPHFRPMLRVLKERDPRAFEGSVRYLEDELLPAVAGEAEPIAAWLAYGRRLAAAVGPGRLVEVGPSGRAHAAGDDAGRGLLLYLPDDAGTPAFVLRCPRPSTRAQDATVELLALGRVSASVYDGR